ncbi:MAG: terminase small subunit [Candidatus Saccharimonadales bacterium]
MNVKQARFVEEYLIDLNATQAAIRAGYSAKTAYAIGNKLLKETEIKETIAAEMQSRSERTGITADKVLADIEAIKADAMKAMADKDGNLAMVNHGAALKACELQGRHLEMWSDKLKVSGEISIADALRARAAARGA